MRAARVVPVALACAAAALVLIVSLLGPANRAVGLRQILITGQSMQPNLAAGDLIYVRKSDSPQVGDVATFQSSPGRFVTHRIVDVVHRGERSDKEGLGTFDGPGEVAYVLKGDANPTPDPYFYPAGNQVGTVRYSLPTAGYAVYFLNKYKLAALMVVALALLTLVLTRKRRVEEVDDGD